MKCEICHKRPAQQALTLHEGQKTKELYVCKECARTHIPSQAQVCPSCGRTWKTVKNTMRMGCPQCWTTFAHELVELDLFKGCKHPYHKGGES